MTSAGGLCGAKTRKGTPCKLPAGHGTNHAGVGRCRRHGGASPQAQLSGVIQLARREAVVMGQPLDVDPHEAILECIRISAGEVRFASDRIAELGLEDAVGAIVTTHERPLKFEKGEESRDETVTEVMHGQPAAHIWIEVRHQAMDRLVKYTKTALDVGIDERRVRVAEAQAMMLAAAIRGILKDLGVADHPDAPAIMRTHLDIGAALALPTGGGDPPRAAASEYRRELAVANGVIEEQKQRISELQARQPRSPGLLDLVNDAAISAAENALTRHTLPTGASGLTSREIAEEILRTGIAAGETARCDEPELCRAVEPINEWICCNLPAGHGGSHRAGPYTWMDGGAQ